MKVVLRREKIGYVICVQCECFTNDDLDRFYKRLFGFVDLYSDRKPR